jgi:undecaprenyl-diphosphatase
VNAYLLSVLLGIVEGLTEFLPVSSTAHLRIAENFLGISMKSGYWKMYSIVIQLGAILSVLVLYGRRLLAYAKTFPKGESGKKNVFTHPLSLIVIASVVTMIPAYLLSQKIEDALESPTIIARALIIGGIVMWLVDSLLKKPTISSVEEMSPLDAVWIGGVQILAAVFPGTSRSMSTIAAGQVFGMSRSAALDFSFLVSLPVMFGACGYSFLKSLKAFKEDPGFVPADLHANPWVVLAIGFVVSFFVALAVNRWFINWVKSRGFAPFAVYRLVLGGVILVLLAKGWMRAEP